MTIVGYKHIENRREYSFECPMGIWKARLDAKAWGTAQNLLLYFTELETNTKYVTLVFQTGSGLPYSPQKGGVNFQNEAEPGESFELASEKTRTGKSKLVTARKLS